MKPHTMLFDEVYSQKLHRSDSVCEYLDQRMDALIVIGTTLQTTLASYIVKKALSRDIIPVVEVNLEGEIRDGYGLIVEERSEKALPILIEKLISN